MLFIDFQEFTLFPEASKGVLPGQHIAWCMRPCVRCRYTASAHVRRHKYQCRPPAALPGCFTLSVTDPPAHTWSAPQAVLQQVFEFVGVDPAGFTFAELPPGMQVRSGGCQCCSNERGALPVLQAQVWSASMTCSSCCAGYLLCPRFGRSPPTGPPPDSVPSTRLQGDRRARRMHPNAKRRLHEYYRESNLKLYSLLGR